MILVAGFGFGGEVFEPLTLRLQDSYTMHVVTLAGFGGTAAPPSPGPGTSFGEQSWTNGAVAALERLVIEQDLREVVLVGHWLGATQVVLRLARRLPERVKAVVLLAGSARWVPATTAASSGIPLQQRILTVDSILAPTWFRTVTRATWDDNNFLPGDYAANPILALRLWREAARPPLHVWVRYLCEFLAQDATVGLEEARAPLLLMLPGLEQLFFEQGANYMDAYLPRSWGGRLADSARIRVVTIPHTRVVMWYDQPEPVVRALDRFMASLPER
jgi:pimeloyl-ACP methyl ester carboxylesterase